MPPAITSPSRLLGAQQKTVICAPFERGGTLDAAKPLAAVGRYFGQRNRDERLRITNRKSGIAPHTHEGPVVEGSCHP